MLANQDHEPKKRPNVLAIDSLSVSLPHGADRPFALQNLSLTIAPGEIHCIVGESGSGKSMTASAVMRLLPRGTAIDTGSVKLSDLELTRLSQFRMRQIRGPRIGMIFQDPMSSLNPLKTIGDQVGEMFRLHTRLGRAEIREKVLKLFADVHLPDPDSIISAYPHQISGGQRQRAMIAMALALDPELLIADEPTTALDVTTQAQILKLIRELRDRRDTGVMFITHDLGVVSEIADRVTVMRSGIVVEQGSADAVLRSPREAYTRELYGALPTLEPKAVFPETKGQPVLQVDGVEKTYHLSGLRSRGRVVRALDGVSLMIPRGLTTGVVGESGSGKSTLAKCVVGLADFDGGNIDISGCVVDRATRGSRRLAKHVQMVFQDPYASLNPRRTVGDLIAQGPAIHGMADPVGRAEKLLKLVGLDSRAKNRFPHEFSGGQRQRIAMARALALEPDLLVADEAVSALDVSVQAQILELLSDIQRELGLTILFITHDLRVTAKICHNIVVMKSGQVVEQGLTRDVLASPRHDYTRELLRSVEGLSLDRRRQSGQNAATTSPVPAMPSAGKD